MAELQSHTIPKEQFLTIAANLLYRSLLDASRTQAKRLFRELESGRTLALTDVKMEDGSTVRFKLALDHSEVDGKLNFGAFRASVTTLVHNLGETLRQEQPSIPVFTAEHRPEMSLYGVTAVTSEDDRPRVMVLGSDTEPGRAEIQLRLTYLSPDQFEMDNPGTGTA